MNTTTAPTTLAEKFLFPLRDLLAPVAVLIAVSGSTLFNLSNLINRDSATAQDAGANPAPYAVSTNATTAEAIAEFPDTNYTTYSYSNRIFFGQGMNITNLTAQQYEAPSVEWIGHPSVVVKNRHGSMEDGWATEVEIGLRSDGVVVWRKAKVEK